MNEPNVIRGARVALYTSYPDRYVEEAILPELRKRGLEIAFFKEAKRAERRDLDHIDVVLHMTEMVGHSYSERLSRACREASIPIRALSRKKASWGFLPPPIETELESKVPEPTTLAEAISESRNEEAPAEEDPMNEALPVANATVSIPVTPAMKRAVTRAANLAAKEETLLSLYEQENDELNKKLEVVQGKLLKAGQDLLQARAEVEAANQEAEIIRAARILVRAGVMSESEAMSKILFPPKF